VSVPSPLHPVHHAAFTFVAARFADAIHVTRDARDGVGANRGRTHEFAAAVLAITEADARATAEERARELEEELRRRGRPEVDGLLT
jgi:hypothetical protein